MVKVIIAGGRDFDNYELLRERCDYFLQNTKDVEIVSGVARGADLLGERYAKERGYPIKRFPANWDLHGRGAGHIRNAEMATYGDFLISFWDGESSGTKLMINLAKKGKLQVRVINY